MHMSKPADNIQVKKVGYIYLVQDGKDKGTNIYKIGRTSQSGDTRKIKRLQNYAEGTIQYLMIAVPHKNVEAIESETIDMLKNKYQTVRGHEWFAGDLLQICRDVQAIISKFQQDVENQPQDVMISQSNFEEKFPLHFLREECDKMTLAHLKGGPQGLAYFFVENVIRGDIVRVDPINDTISYFDGSKQVTDPKAKKLIAQIVCMTGHKADDLLSEFKQDGDFESVEFCEFCIKWIKQDSAAIKKVASCIAKMYRC